MADERLDDDARERRRGLLAAGDPQGHVRDAWTEQEAVREIYRIADPDLALEWVEELAATLDDRTYGPEVRRLGRMLARWAPQIAAWHRSRASNGPVEAIITRRSASSTTVATGTTPPLLIAMIYLCCGGITVELPTGT